MNLAHRGAYLPTKTHLALLTIIVCIFVPFLPSATALGDRPVHENARIEGQDANTSDQSDPPHANSGVPITHRIGNPGTAPKQPLSPSLFGPEGALDHGQLLVDPSYPLFHPPALDGVLVANPASVVSSALLTAATSLPTAPHDASLHHPTNASSHHQTRKFPVLSGSMTVSVPTTPPPVPAASAAPTAAISTPSPAVTTPTEAPTPTTSTADVYPPDPPQPPSRAPPAINSAAHRSFLASPRRNLGWASCALLAVLQHL